MQYRETKLGKLSCLGLGCMRLPKSDEIAEQIVVKAVEGGINYLDTAYIYGDSEERLGRILTKHQMRDKVYLATKLPLIMLRKAADIESYFSTELKRLQTDHVDFYMMHMLPDITYWNKLKEWGIIEWLKQKKESGAIRHVGFSFHGTKQAFMDLIDVYDWEFCLLQYNYIDEFNQTGIEGIRKAYDKGLPVMIMEPLLGGRLVDGLPVKGLDLLKVKGLDPAQFGLNWIWNQPEPTVILSGMSTIEQLEQNLAWADKAEVGMLSADDLAVYDQIKAIFSETDKIHCTGCNYCMPCPRNVNIPSCFKSYNMSYSDGYFAGMQNYLKEAGIVSTKLATAGNCTGCGKCEKHCPQKIAIRQELQNVKKRLEPLWFRIGSKVARKIMKRG